MLEDFDRLEKAHKKSHLSITQLAEENKNLKIQVQNKINELDLCKKSNDEKGDNFINFLK